MTDGISRRDFLNGMALAITAGFAPANALHAASVAPYPPITLGMRGSTDASYEAAHALRDGRRFAIDSLAIEDTVDLVVVGAGISGLAAAHYFRRDHPRARILILDNHDDFGGHARRCEMSVDGRCIIGYGGSESIQSPASDWSESALMLLHELGVHVPRLAAAFDRTLYPDLGLSRGILFTRESFSMDKLVPGDPTRMVADDIPPDRLNARTPESFIGDFPLDAASRAQLVALYTTQRDVLAGKTHEQKEALLTTISYRNFLTRHWGLSDQAAAVFQKRSHDFFAIGIDDLAAADAAATGYPGFQGLQLPLDVEAQAEMDEPYIYHFPDGNASIARLLVRKLIPSVAAGSTMEDIVGSKFDYSRLDVASSMTRMRLESTVVSIANRAGGRVDIGYMHQGQLKRIQAKRAVYAGYNMMLPYLAVELGAPQREALVTGVKAPLVYTKVAVRNWEAWARAGVHEVTNPMGFYSRIKLDYPVSLGTYEFAKSPREPVGLHLVHVPTPANMADQRKAWRAGRTLLHATPFEYFEAKAVDELSRILGTGFDPKRDIAAISVYRWAHGYAYGFNSLYDKVQQPEVSSVARRRFGRVSIANSDAAWSAYAHSAIDEGARAIEELRET